MKLSNRFSCCIFALAGLGLLFPLTGCDSNPTNEPSKQAIEDADKKRAKAIDDDPSMTAEGKKKLKEMLHLDKVDTAGSKKG